MGLFARFTECDTATWNAESLKPYGSYSECVTYCNQSEDYADSMRGDWYYCDDDTETVYFGTFGTYHSPGASHYTHAETFRNREEYLAAKDFCEAQPEYL